MLNHSRRAALLETARDMNRLGLNQGMSGNVSLRLKNGFLITPSALAYGACGPADMVELDMEGKGVRGQHKPSSEWQLHRDMYRSRPEAGAVLHCHSPWCTTLACLEQGIPAFHYMVAMAGGDSIACAEYALFGTSELSAKTLAALSNGRRACLLAHHGLVCIGPDLEEALTLAVEVENLARCYGQARQIGAVPLLSAAEMEEVREKFTSYRPAS
jgi:L-fuculose-phosphate aldolase